ncbi:hypothetical protein VNI00_011595 [Paramarasmius palmivorus]|uniref:Uncharacterized protein n=1 Tax=Paramarasmius palmivorus TaxID=297713 RepID=A0AAW0CE85_9AGAR
MRAQAQAHIGSIPGSRHAPGPQSRASSTAPALTREVSHREQAQATSATASHNSQHPTTRITSNMHSTPTTERQLEPASRPERQDPSGTEGDDKLAHVSAPPASISASPSPPRSEGVARVLHGSAAGAVLMEVRAGVVATPDDHHTTPKHEMRESLSALTPAPEISSPIRDEACQEMQDKAGSSSRIGTQSPKTSLPLSTNTFSHATTALEGNRSPDRYHARARPRAAGDNEKEVQGALPGALTSPPASPSYSKGCAENRSKADVTAPDASQDLPTRRVDMEDAQCLLSKLVHVIGCGRNCWLPLSMAELARLAITFGGMLGFALITYAYYYS